MYSVLVLLNLKLLDSRVYRHNSSFLFIPPGFRPLTLLHHVCGRYPTAYHSHKIIQFTFSLVHGPDSRSIMGRAQHIIEVACDIKITMHGLSNPHDQNPIQSTRKINTWVGLEWVRPVRSLGHLPSTHITVEVANIELDAAVGLMGRVGQGRGQGPRQDRARRRARQRRCYQEHMVGV